MRLTLSEIRANAMRFAAEWSDVAGERAAAQTFWTELFAAAQGAPDARAAFPDQTLADLYDPLAMPKALRDAHKALDRAVDRCYRAQPFAGERQWVEYLFDLYQKLATPLTAPAKKPKRKAKADAAE